MALSSHMNSMQALNRGLKNWDRDKMALKFPQNPSRSYRAAPKGDSVHRPGTGAMHPSQPHCNRAVGTGGSQQHQDQKAKGTVPCPEMAAGPDLLQQMQQDGSPLAKMP